MIGSYDLAIGPTLIFRTAEVDATDHSSGNQLGLAPGPIGKLAGPWVAETANVWRLAPRSSKQVESI